MVRLIKHSELPQENPSNAEKPKSVSEISRGISISFAERQRLYKQWQGVMQQRFRDGGATQDFDDWLKENVK